LETRDALALSILKWDGMKFSDWLELTSARRLLIGGEANLAQQSRMAQLIILIALQVQDELMEM
jgi:hypothetical protein